MRLVSRVLGILIRGGARLVAVMAIGLVVVIAAKSLTDAVENEAKLEKVVKERKALQRELHELTTAQNEVLTSSFEEVSRRTRAGVDEFTQRLADENAAVREAEKLRDAACDFWGKVGDALTPVESCKAAQRAVHAAERTRDIAKHSLDEFKKDERILRDPNLTKREKLQRLHEKAGDRQIDDQIKLTKSRLDGKEDREDTLRAELDSLAGEVVSQWDESRAGVLGQWSRQWVRLLLIALAVLFAPAIWRTVAYWLVMPTIFRLQKPKPLADDWDPRAVLTTGPAKRTLTIQLTTGEVLSARSKYVRTEKGQTQSRLFHDFSAPFTSYAAGLYALTRFTGDGAEAALAARDNPNSYLMRIDFSDHPGVVMHPTHVVGVIGTPEVQPKWRWGIQALATWQVRYIKFGGTGGLIIQGNGDAVAKDAGDPSTRVEQDLVMGYDSRLVARVDRTGAFLPYLVGTASLLADHFTGPYPYFWQQDPNPGSGNPVTKFVNNIYSAIGKLLGF